MSRRDYSQGQIRKVRSKCRDRCFYCKKDLSAGFRFDGRMIFDKVSIDHLTPISKGGGNTIDNMVLACPACNQDKADIEYDLFVARRIQKKPLGIQKQDGTYLIPKRNKTT